MMRRGAPAGSEQAPPEVGVALGPHHQEQPARGELLELLPTLQVTDHDTSGGLKHRATGAPPSQDSA
jgi:hypothetical protein